MTTARSTGSGRDADVPVELQSPGGDSSVPASDRPSVPSVRPASDAVVSPAPSVSQPSPSPPPAQASASSARAPDQQNAASARAAAAASSNAPRSQHGVMSMATELSESSEMDVRADAHEGAAATFTGAAAPPAEHARRAAAVTVAAAAVSATTSSSRGVAAVVASSSSAAAVVARGASVVVRQPSRAQPSADAAAAKPLAAPPPAAQQPPSRPRAVSESSDASASEDEAMRPTGQVESQAPASRDDDKKRQTDDAVRRPVKAAAAAADARGRRRVIEDGDGGAQAAPPAVASDAPSAPVDTSAAGDEDADAAPAAAAADAPAQSKPAGCASNGSAASSVSSAWISSRPSRKSPASKPSTQRSSSAADDADDRSASAGQDASHADADEPVEARAGAGGDDTRAGASGGDEAAHDDEEYVDGDDFVEPPKPLPSGSWVNFAAVHRKVRQKLGTRYDELPADTDTAAPDPKVSHALASVKIIPVAKAGPRGPPRLQVLVDPSYFEAPDPAAAASAAASAVAPAGDNKGASSHLPPLSAASVTPVPRGMENYYYGHPRDRKWLHQQRMLAASGGSAAGTGGKRFVKVQPLRYIDDARAMMRLARLEGQPSAGECACDRAHWLIGAATDVVAIRALVSFPPALQPSWMILPWPRSCSGSSRRSCRRKALAPPCSTRQVRGRQCRVPFVVSMLLSRCSIARLLDAA